MPLGCRADARKRESPAVSEKLRRQSEPVRMLTQAQLDFHAWGAIDHGGHHLQTTRVQCHKTPVVQQGDAGASDNVVREVPAGGNAAVPNKSSTGVSEATPQGAVSCQ